MRVERSIVLPTTPAEAWRVLMDWERQPDWMADADRVTVVSPRRYGSGVELEVHTRVLGVPALTERIQVIGWDPPRRLVIRHGKPVAGTGTWALVRVDGGTRFTWVEEARLAAPVVGGLAAAAYAPVVRRLMRRSMERLRRHVIALGPADPRPDTNGLDPDGNRDLDMA
jgi:carbon monoxide dehydrogenase subunit G